MKLLFASSLALLGVDASYKTMKASYAKLIQGNRNLLTTSIANVNNYGCWCYFDDQVGNGKGEPMDLIDAECRNLHRGYECAVADFGAGCVPWEVTYFPVAGTQFLDDLGLNEACIHTNTVLTNFGNCATAACSIETEFIAEYTAITQNYNPQFSLFSHENEGNFNPQRNCVAPTGGTPDKGERECCGTYPNRYPFKVYAATSDRSACCDGSVFKQATHKCCDSDTVKPTNQAC